MRITATAALVSLLLLTTPSAYAGPSAEIIMEPAPVAYEVMAVSDLCCSDCLSALPPGEHTMTFLHPYTCCPVCVTFCLPCGCYKVDCEKGLCAKKIRFAYPGLCNDVVIKFKKDGSVVVK